MPPLPASTLRSSRCCQKSETPDRSRSIVDPILVRARMIFPPLSPPPALPRARAASSLRPPSLPRRRLLPLRPLPFACRRPSLSSVLLPVSPPPSSTLSCPSLFLPLPALSFCLEPPSLCLVAFPAVVPTPLPPCLLPSFSLPRPSLASVDSPALPLSLSLFPPSAPPLPASTALLSLSLFPPSAPPLPASTTLLFLPSFLPLFLAFLKIPLLSLPPASLSLPGASLSLPRFSSSRFLSSPSLSLSFCRFLAPTICSGGSLPSQLAVEAGISRSRLSPSPSLPRLPTVSLPYIGLWSDGIPCHSHLLELGSKNRSLYH